MRVKLQPGLTFQDEATRLNQLYWKVRYSLRCLAGAGSAAPTPTADEKKNLGKPGSDERLLESLRVAAILHMCSAFEHALVSYYALCLLYRPDACTRLKQFKPLPLLLTDAQKLHVARRRAQSRANGVLKSTYAARLTQFGIAFGIDVTWIDAKLDEHYKTRNKIAHDQALDGADDPALSSAEVISRCTTLSEAEWKEMLGVFTRTVARLDKEVAKSVVKDHGLSLAVYRTVEKNPKATYKEVCHAVLNEWGIHAELRSKADVLYAIGLVEQGRGATSLARERLTRSLELRPSADVQAALKQLLKKRSKKKP